MEMTSKTALSGCLSNVDLLLCFAEYYRVTKYLQNILDFNADYTRNMEAFVVHDFNQTTSTYSTGATIINLYNNVSHLIMYPYYVLHFTANYSVDFAIIVRR